jgi:hypothetical protein
MIAYTSENEIPSDKSGKMTAIPIKTLGFQDRLFGVTLSFDFVYFVKKKKLVWDLPSHPCLVHFNWNIFMKSYAGNWQINRNSQNRMSEKILSERIPLNGQWNNRTSPTWPETRHGREGRSRTSFFFQNWDLNWQLQRKRNTVGQVR